MPPTHLLSGNVNMFHPYVVGQSGTERPESVLVTMPPAAISRTVHTVTSLTYRWCQSITSSRMLQAGGSRPLRVPSYRRLEREGDLFRVLLAERDRLCLAAELFVH